MKCESCGAEATAEQLVQGRCLSCNAKENTVFRLMLSHIVMAIESGQPTTHPNFGTCFTQDFGEAFLNHLKEVLHAVKRLSVPPPPITPTSQRCKCGAHMQMLWAWDDDQQTDHAFNVYGCDYCGLILKTMVTEDNRENWIAMES